VRGLLGFWLRFGRCIRRLLALNFTEALSAGIEDRGAWLGPQEAILGFLVLTGDAPETRCLYISIRNAVR
jgi:hypothetical protein